MELKLRKQARVFSPLKGIELKDMGDIRLAEDEQVTFRTPGGRANDVIRKSWGFYLCNSLNVNLKKQGFKTALVLSQASGDPRMYINLVEIEKLDEFSSYLAEYDACLISWLDEWFDA